MQRGIDYIGIGVGAVILDEAGKLFMTLRGQEVRNERGKWQIPGGCIELGETTEQALKREVREEHGIEIEVGELFSVFNHFIPHELQHWIAVTYVCKIIQGEPKNLEPDKCEKLGWFTLEEAEKLSLSLVMRYNLNLLKEKFRKILGE